MKRYDKTYCDDEKYFKGKECKHSDVVPYNVRGSKRVTAMQSICTRCGQISNWTKTINHTLGGGFEYEVTF